VKKLRVAVVGLGHRARAHVPLLQIMSDKFEVVALCDANAEQARRAGEEYGARWYSDLGTMLKEEELDIVDIVLPPDAHHVAAVMAAEHGVNIMCETPITISRPLADAMIEAAERNGVKLEVAEQVYRWPEEQLKHKIIKSGIIGETLRVYCRFRTGGYHAINAMRAYSDWAPPKRIWGHGRTFAVTPHDRFGSVSQSEDWEHAIIEFENGIIGVYEQVGNWINPFRIDLKRRLGVDSSNGFIDENDVYIFDGAKNQHLQIRTETVDVQGVAVPARYLIDSDPPIVWENPYTQYPVGDSDGIARIDYWHSLYNAIVNDCAPNYGALQGRMDQELPIAFRESARLGGQPIDFPLPAITPYEERLHDDYLKTYGSDPYRDIEKLAARKFPRWGVRWAV
jgi:hypothetical protein